jgi:hypothetical protein
VEIDGLGTFEESVQGYRFLPETRPQVFIAYVAEDLAPARGAARQRLLSLARQRKAASGTKLAARHRTGNRDVRRLRGVLFTAIGRKAGPVSERIALRARLRAAAALSR